MIPSTAGDANLVAILVAKYGKLAMQKAVTETLQSAQI